MFAGLVSSDSLAPLRARLTGGRTTHRTRAPAPRARMRGPSGLALLSAGRSGRPSASGRTGIRRGVPPSVVGRWSLVPGMETDTTVRTHAAAEVLLDRHGIVTRGAVVAEGTVGGFAAVYRVLAALEETGRIRRGYFVEGLGASQFASAGAVDRVRSFAARPDQGTEAATRDWCWRRPTRRIRTAPHCPGPALRIRGPAVVGGPGDEPTADGAAGTNGGTSAVDRHRPARRAGALTVLVDGAAVLFAERGGRSLLTFTADPELLAAAAEALAERVRSGRIGSLTISKLDGSDVLTASGAVVDALTAAGFTMTPRGLRLRSSTR